MARTATIGTFDHGVFDRGRMRGQNIFPLFKYQIPGVMPEGAYREREIIFGVYAGAYLHGYNYLADITAEDLAQAVAKFDAAVSEMSAEEARVLVDIAAKRYIQNQELAVRDAAIMNKRAKLANQTAEMDAKVAALDADRAAIETQRTRLNVAREKVAVEVDDLTTKIAEQAVDAASTEAEIARQELASRKAALDLIEAGIRALEIQAAVADAAYRMAEVDVRKTDAQADVANLALEESEVPIKASDIQADTAQLQARTATETLVESDLQVEQAQLYALREEVRTIGPAKRGLIQQKIVMNATEKGAVLELQGAAADEATAEGIAQEARNSLVEAGHRNRADLYDAKRGASDTERTLEVTKVIPGEVRIINEGSRASDALDAARVYANDRRNDGAYEAAGKIAQANIVNTLTHQIGAATVK